MNHTIWLLFITVAVIGLCYCLSSKQLSTTLLHQLTYAHLVNVYKYIGSLKEGAFLYLQNCFLICSVLPFSFLLHLLFFFLLPTYLTNCCKSSPYPQLVKVKLNVTVNFVSCTNVFLHDGYPQWWWQYFHVIIVATEVM